MLNGVGNQFVHDECERHSHVGGDNEWVGIDDQRPRPIWAARCGCDCLTKINKVAVKRHCSNIAIPVKLLVDEGDSRDARRCIVELIRSGPRCFSLQVRCSPTTPEQREVESSFAARGAEHASLAVCGPQPSILVLWGACTLSVFFAWPSFPGVLFIRKPNRDNLWWGLAADALIKLTI